LKVQILSDLHFEFHKDYGESFLVEMCPEEVDVLAVAGDLANFPILSESVIKLCARYKEKPVLFVPGNHEFYGSDFPKTLRVLSNLESKISNFKCLYNQAFTYQDRTFFGSTLWFPTNEGVEQNYKKINDYFCITNFADYVYRHNSFAVQFLGKAKMARAFVITHHIPTHRSVHEVYKSSKISEFFVCALDELILRGQPRYWVHGHQHRSCDYAYGDTRVICNPMGYARKDLNLDFNYNLIVEY
jgi:Icc-related predicted phosphoesterase